MINCHVLELKIRKYKEDKKSSPMYKFICDVVIESKYHKIFDPSMERKFIQKQKYIIIYNIPASSIKINFDAMEIKGKVFITRAVIEDGKFKKNSDGKICTEEIICDFKSWNTTNDEIIFTNRYKY